MDLKLTYIVNKVIFIISLVGNHKESAEDLYKYHISKYYDNTDIYYVNSKEALIVVLEKIERELGSEEFPLIHLESHGLSSGKGLELNNGDRVSWSELTPCFEKINVKSCNNLSICISACFAMYIVEELVYAFYRALDSRVPFFSFVAPESRIGVDELTNAFPEFYKSLNESKDLMVAVRHMNQFSSSRFRTDICYTPYHIGITDFAETWLRNRANIIREDPSKLKSVYCQLYFYTYGRNCDAEAILEILTSENFYLDYFNKRLEDFLIISDCPEMRDRFPTMDNINNFHRTIPELSVQIT